MFIIKGVYNNLRNIINMDDNKIKSFKPDLYYKERIKLND